MSLIAAIKRWLKRISIENQLTSSSQHVTSRPMSGLGGELQELMGDNDEAPPQSET